MDVKVRSKSDGVYACSYTPTSALKHTVSVAWGGVSVPNSPFRVSSQSQRSVTTGRFLLKSKDVVKTESVEIIQSETLVKAERVRVVQSEQSNLKKVKSKDKKKKPLIIITYTEERYAS